MLRDQYIIVRFDKKTKNELKEFSAKVGMSMSVIIYSQVRLLLRDGMIFSSPSSRLDRFTVKPRVIKPGSIKNLEDIGPVGF